MSLLLNNNRIECTGKWRAHKSAFDSNLWLRATKPSSNGYVVAESKVLADSKKWIEALARTPIVAAHVELTDKGPRFYIHHRPYRG
jgi:hypothetical protein